MDEKARKAEELLEERLRTRGPNGHANVHTESDAIEPAGAGSDDARVIELTNDLKRMAADFANYRKRNEAERTEFLKFAKSDLIAKLLDVLDGYDRALATVPEELKGQPWVEGMWLVERKLRGILEGEGLEPVESVGKLSRSSFWWIPTAVLHSCSPVCLSKLATLPALPEPTTMFLDAPLGCTVARMGDASKSASVRSWGLACWNHCS